jgi:hypothetical protein
MSTAPAPSTFAPSAPRAPSSGAARVGRWFWGSAHKAPARLLAAAPFPTTPSQLPGFWQCATRPCILPCPQLQPLPATGPLRIASPRRCCWPSLPLSLSHTHTLPPAPLHTFLPCIPTNTTLRCPRPAAPRSNAEFLEFVRDGGYRDPRWWSEDGWRWRTFRNAKWPSFWVPQGPQGLHDYRLRLCFEVVELPPALPAVVNHHEARAYANWLSAKQVGDCGRWRVCVCLCVSGVRGKVELGGAGAGGKGGYAGQVPARSAAASACSFCNPSWCAGPCRSPAAFAHPPPPLSCP